MAKNKNHEGCFRTLSNGTLEYQVTLENALYGNRRRKAFYGATESECRKKYKQWLKNGGEQQQPQKSEEYALSEWIDEWLKIYKEKKVQSSTHADYVYLAAHIKKHRIGNMKLSQVKPLHVTEFFASIIDYSHSVRKKTRYLLTAAFETAIDNDLCLKNPVRRAEIATKPQDEKEAYTEDETRAILEFAKTDKLFGLPMYIMLNTGIRSGEMRALTADKIDFENAVIKIDRAIKKSGELGKPKNGKTRYIPLEPEVFEFLAEKIDRNARYLIGNSHYVTAAGFRSRYLWFFHRLNKHLESKGKEPIPTKPPHSTRHTFGTLRQKRGMPIAIVSQLLGHSSTVTTDKYTHLGDVSILSEAVNKYSFLSQMVE